MSQTTHWRLANPLNLSPQEKHWSLNLVEDGLGETGSERVECNGVSRFSYVCEKKIIKIIIHRPNISKHVLLSFLLLQP